MFAYRNTLGSVKLYGTLSILILTFLCSCTIKNSKPIQITPSENMDHIDIGPTTLTPLPSPTPTLSLTVTSTIEVASTSTPTITPALTVTPFPTFLPDEKLQIVEDLFLTNGGCQFPCWWGFVPGETSWEDAKQTILRYAFDLHEQDRGDYLYVSTSFKTSEKIFFGDYGYIDTIYFVKDGKIDLIQSFLPNYNLYYVPQLFEMYGPPDAINVDTDPYESLSGDPFPVNLYLMYEKLGFWVFMRDARVSGEGMNLGCFQKERTLIVVLGNPSQLMTQERISDILINFSVPRAYPLEEFSSWTIPSFYQAALDGSDPLCIELKQEDFLPEK